MYLSKVAAAKFLGCCTKTIEAHIKSGRLTAIHIGAPGAKRQTIRVSQASLNAFVEASVIPPDAPPAPRKRVNDRSLQKRAARLFPNVKRR